VKRLVAVGCIALAGAALLYATKIAYMFRQAPVELIGCIDVEAAWMSWTCKQVLLHGGLDHSKVDDLNHHAGALYAVSVKNQSDASQILVHFKSAGVDINARDVTAKGRTALHSTVASGSVWQTALLLRNGASMDVPDESGLTPLALALMLAAQFPEKQEYKSVVELLEHSSIPAIK
jgi:ankyrin repeat protein